MRMYKCYLRIALRARSASGLLDALGLGYDLPVGEAVYAIDDFPDDDLLWRIEWIGGVGYNTSVPSDPLMDVCIAQPPAGETNPLSARFCTVANNVGDSVALNLAFNTSAHRTVL